MPDQFIGTRLRCPNPSCRQVFEVSPENDRPSNLDVYALVEPAETNQLKAVEATPPSPPPIVDSVPETATAKVEEAEERSSIALPRWVPIGGGVLALAAALVIVVLIARSVGPDPGPATQPVGAATAPPPLVRPPLVPPPIPQPEAPRPELVAQPKIENATEVVDQSMTGDEPVVTEDDPIPIERNVRLVARVEGETSTGTGFVASPGLFVKNWHVTASEYLKYLTLRFPGDQPRAPENPAAMGSSGRFGLDAQVRRATSMVLVYEDPDRDLAILRVDAKHEPMVLDHDETFRVGEEVWIVGNPAIGGSNHVSKGIRSTRAQLGEPARWFEQLSIASNPGDSGGPVLGAAGRVIGVTTLKASRQEGMAFSVPLADVREALRAAERATPEQVRRLTLLHEARALFANLSTACGAALEIAAADAGSRVVAKPALQPDQVEARLRPLRVLGLSSLEEELAVLGMLSTTSDVLSERTLRDLTELHGIGLELIRRVRGDQGLSGMMSGGNSSKRTLPEIRDRIGGLAEEISLDLGVATPSPPDIDPPLEVVHFKVKTQRLLSTTSVKVEGAVRNCSGGPLVGLQVHALMLDPRGRFLGRAAPKLILPDRLEDGGEGKFSVNLTGLFQYGMVVEPIFTDSEDRALGYRRAD